MGAKGRDIAALCCGLQIRADNMSAGRRAATSANQRRGPQGVSNSVTRFEINVGTGRKPRRAAVIAAVVAGAASVAGAQTLSPDTPRAAAQPPAQAATPQLIQTPPPADPAYQTNGGDAVGSAHAIARTRPATESR